jgi:hypothetical protein
MIPDFRDFIHEQLRNGTLSSDTLIAIVRDNAREETPLRKQGDELIDSFFARQ